MKRKLQRSAHIDGVRFATAKSPIGWVLVAASERGICAVELGDSASALAARLRRHVRATPATGDDPVRGWATKIARRLAQPVARSAALPLHLRGSPFQLKVWRALTRIPAGTTASYTDIAAKIGRPNAVRAVARACASNTVALLVPCHRVIRSDGALSGYRWGIERKRALLEIENGGIGYGDR